MVRILGHKTERVFIEPVKICLTGEKYHKLMAERWLGRKWIRARTPHLTAKYRLPCGVLLLLTRREYRRVRKKDWLEFCRLYCPNLKIKNTDECPFVNPPMPPFPSRSDKVQRKRGGRRGRQMS